MWMIVPLAIVVHFLAFGQTQAASCGYFNVLPESEALVFDRSGTIKRKVGPGLQICVPFFETVLVENTLFERQEDVETSLRDNSCKIKVSVIWSVSDLETYYTLGQETAAAIAIRRLVQQAVASADFAEVGGEAISSFLHAALRENGSAFNDFGIKFHRVLPSPGLCIKG